MIKRAIADVCILIECLIRAVVGDGVHRYSFLFYFSNYYELIAAGVLVDVLYGNNSTPLFHIPFIFSIDSVVFYVLVHFLKTKMRMYI